MYARYRKDFGMSEIARDNSAGSTTKLGATEVQDAVNGSAIDVDKMAVRDDELEVKHVVDNCWNSINMQGYEPEKKLLDQSKGWKTIRVFVSSTFADMHSEREILIKKVFPALREWCEERKFTLIDCDLRWGVPKDSSTRMTICTCMEELDRCLEDNDNLPFFINLLSERYGWIPSDSDVPDDISLKYQWISHLSITHMEILHGAYRFNNPNALFCLRDPDFVKDIPADKMSNFVDKEPLNRLHLKMLKTKLAERFPDQIFHYSGQVAGTDMSTGRAKVKIVGLEALGEKVLKFLCDAIEKQYPDHNLVSDVLPFEQEENAHLSMMQSKSAFVVGREQEMNTLFHFIQTKQADDSLRTVSHDDDDSFLQKLEEECTSFGVEQNDGRIVALVGGIGFGKSAILAKFACDALSAGVNVLYHHVGCSLKSMDASTVVLRLQVALSQSLPSSNDESNESGDNWPQIASDELVPSMKQVLTSARSSDKQLVLIIDGLDDMSDNDFSSFLSWLPPRFPANISCIVSSRDSHVPCRARLESRDAYFLDVKELTTDGALNMVQHYLNKFNKRLDATQLDCLIQHKSFTIPLWLAIASEEMRTFGDFATITDKIRNFPDELNELAKDVLQRLLNEDETQCVEKLLSLIHCSTGGLPEKYVLQLLGDINTTEQASMQSWAIARRYIKPFIQITADQRHGISRIKLSHGLFYDAVKELILPDVDKMKQWHTYLADYFQFHCTDESLILQELPDQLYKAGCWQRLMEFYRSDVRSLYTHASVRSKHLNMIRCQTTVFRNMPHTCLPVLVCSLCATQSRRLSPGPYRTADVCAVCGNWVTNRTNATPTAVVCQRHAFGQNNLLSKCFLCNRMITLQSGPSFMKMHEELCLCLFCSMGRGGMQCCRLLDCDD